MNTSRTLSLFRGLPSRDWEREANAPTTPRPILRVVVRVIFVIAALIVVGVLAWRGVTAAGNPDPAAAHISPTVAMLDIGVLVFREGLECILVFSAVMASMVGTKASLRRPVLAGAGIAFIGTLITWFVAVGILSNLTGSVSALNLQAATGLLAVSVLLVIMNWFFHKIYWGGWMSLHHRRRKTLLAGATEPESSKTRIRWGLGLLGFTSLYREGFEVVLFLQSYYLRLGRKAVLGGAILGLFFTGAVAALTFLAHRRLPHRKMLILTGLMLGIVLLVMVGEQAQEMQLANWIPTTPIKRLSNVLPAWIGLWFSVFPTLETLAAQSLAAILVIGSYFLARAHTRPCQDQAAVILGQAPDFPMQVVCVGQNQSEKCRKCGMKLVEKR
jgi:high-affinity iron transporter